MPSGRPRLPTLAELRQQASLEVNKVNGGRLPNGLRELKEMMKLRNLRLGEAILPEPSLSQKGG